MMKKFKRVLKRYQMLIIPALIVLLFGVGAMVFYLQFKTAPSLKKLNTKTYAIEYDSTWKVKTKKDDFLLLTHKNGSKVNFKMTPLTSEYRYDHLSVLADEILYEIKKQNSQYQLLSMRQSNFGKYQYDGFQFLYESEHEQVMIWLYKWEDRLFTITYEAFHDDFDILFDSVERMVNHLEVKEESFSLESQINIETTQIDYSNANDIDQYLTDRKTYEIAKQHYLVEYTIPSCFTQKTIDSTLGYFTLLLDDYSINITVDILERNIYEYLDKNQPNNLYSNYITERSYANFKENLDKLNDDGYVYKNSYEQKVFNYLEEDEEKMRKDENAELVYPLDRNHLLKVVIKAKGLPITKKLLEEIKISSSKNYASYIKIEKEEENLLGKLMRFKDSNPNQIERLTLKLPDTYQELDKGQNIYLERYYALNQQSSLDLYQVHYQLTNSSIDSIVKIINTSSILTTYGDYEYITYAQELTLNGKKFIVYRGGYTNLEGIMLTNIDRDKYYVNKVVLFYQMPTTGYLCIEIDGNDQEISSEILNELTNFVIE